MQGAEYAPLNGRIGWIIGHDKQRRLRKVGGFSPAAMKTWPVWLSGCSVKAFALNGSNIRTVKEHESDPKDRGNQRGIVDSVQRHLGNVSCFGSEVVVFGLRRCDQQMAPAVLRSLELEPHIDVTSSSLNG